MRDVHFQLCLSSDLQSRGSQKFLQSLEDLLDQSFYRCHQIVLFYETVLIKLIIFSSMIGFHLF